MSTESPMRFIGSSIVSNWPGSKDTTFSACRRNVAELELLLEDDAFRGNREFTAPSRSGSAPPTMEGSSMTIGDLSGLPNSRFNSINGKYVSFESCHSDGQLHVDPAYVPYNNDYHNLKPRIPRPPPSQENRRFQHHWRMPFFDDNNKRSVPTSRLVLPTRKGESEHDGSPNAEFDNCGVQSTSGSMFGQSTSFQDHCKINVHLTQGDFLWTPSPVYNGQSHPLSHVVLEQKTDADARVNSSDDSTKNMIKSELEALTASVNTCVSSSDVSISKVHSLGTRPLELAAVSIVCSSNPVLSDTCNPDPGLAESKDENLLYNSVLPVSATVSNTISIGKDIKNLKISTDAYKSQPARQSHHQNNLQSRVPSFPVHLGESQITNQGMPLFNLVDLFSHGQSKLSSMEIPALQSADIVPTLYATAAAYGAPYYTGMQPSNLFPPQFGIGGFSDNTSLLPPFLSAYLSYDTISMPFQTPAGPNYSARASSISPGGNITGYYGHLGIVSQPSYTEPMYVSYFQHPSAHAYASAGQFDPMVSGGSAIGSSSGFNMQKGPLPVAYSSDQRSQVLRTGPLNTPSIRKGGTASTNFYGSPSNVGLFMQYPTSPLTSPVYPASPVANTGSFGRRSESSRSPGSSGQAGGAYSGWQGPKLRDKVDDSKSLSFLEELKSSRSRRYDISDITGRIVEFSADQHGSRFIQQKLESCSVEEKASVFDEVLPHASTLMTDVFGNYVIQKFFEHGSPEQRKELGNQLIGRILPLSLQMYGCRVIQKALEVIELDQKTQLVHELDGNVMRCVRDQNGNHVIQKCIECVPTEKIVFIISAFRGHVATLSMHPYGCRVIQRVLEHCTDEFQNQCIVDEILQSACILAQDQYGNYVTQHVLERGKPLERSQIINKLSGQVVQMSQHKFASNVIEKCLEHGNSTERELLIVEILGQTEGNDNLLIMMKDQFANYVVQKILEVCTDMQRELLLDRIQSHLQALKKYTYGKHIVARVEQLFVDEEESPTSGS